MANIIQTRIYVEKVLLLSVFLFIFLINFPYLLFLFFFFFFVFVNVLFNGFMISQHMYLKI